MTDNKFLIECEDKVRKLIEKSEFNANGCLITPLKGIRGYPLLFIVLMVFVFLFLGAISK
jgi:hypothetical protein